LSASCAFNYPGPLHLASGAAIRSAIFVAFGYIDAAFAAAIAMNNEYEFEPEGVLAAVAPRCTSGQIDSDQKRERVPA
jgi:hypothetical protein